MEGLEHHAAGGGVQVARGLVGEDDRRVVHERAGDGHALHLAAGELVGAVVVVVNGQARRREGRYGPLLALATRAVGVDERELHVVEHAHAREQVEALEHEADALGADLGELAVVELGHVQALE